MSPFCHRTWHCQEKDISRPSCFHMFVYLLRKEAQCQIVVFDPTYPEIDMSVFKECDWKEFYGNIMEAIPPNTPESRGKDIKQPTFVLRF
jgi:hypothetical protein